MSDVHTAPDGSVIPVITPADTGASYQSANEAAKELSNIRFNRDNPEPASAEPAAEPTEESTQVEEAAPPTEDPGETTEAQEPAEMPPIEPPRSWSKADKEEFATYPREAQEKIARREQERETALRRAQNEQAEKLKGLTAREQAAEQARLSYEQALPALLQTLQDQQQGEFSDVKTMADVEKLAREDWPRYALWDAQQKKIAAVQQEMKSAQERQTAQQQQQWQAFVEQEDKKFLDNHPELQDPDKLRKAGEAVLSTLQAHGLTKQEAMQAWNTPAYRTAAAQEIMLKAALYDQAKAQAAKPAPKPLPPVLKPGTPGVRVSTADAELRALEKMASETNNPRDMAKLLVARRRARG